MSGEKSVNTYDQYIYIGFLLLIAWLPLPLGSNRPWAWAIMEVWTYLLAMFWLAEYMFHRVKFTVSFLNARPIIYLFLMWLLWVLLQIIPLPVFLVELISPQAAAIHALSPEPSKWITLSVDPYATKVAWLKSLAYVLIFSLALLLIRRRRRVHQLVYVLIFSAVFQAVYGSLMTLSGVEYGFFIEKTTSVGHATGTFTNRNHLAGYLVMGLAVGIGIMIASLDTYTGYSLKQQIRNILRLFMSEKLRLRLYLVMMVIALVLTHSRMGNTAFFASLLIAGGIGLLLSRYATRPTVILLASLIIIDICIVGTWFGIEKVIERIEQTTFETENRDEVYPNVFDQWSDYKIIGSGLGSFYSVFPKYRKQDISGYYDHAHNDYLEIGSESGIIGFILLGLVVLISLCVALFAQYKRRDPLMRGLSFAAIMGICAILIHSTVDFNLQIPANAVSFILLLSFAWISYSLKPNSSRRKSIRKNTIHKTRL